ncbi:MAG TPA: hypothetical protein PKA28_20140 [Methylomusa anaerophila]|uniref:Uncharacterized protein n=1 Tax=Methylomusa anaerophila TaxID=1930071 RepID=A0A348AIH7_9FIRM|nr:hypothetical protein [Methylomusa anaerophila]BBB90875.1 hypothetical protein MAMMFC1_01542 [Methylomusa anaerophila]HML90743.1 hypothetical protein [Methylomusa anaerophila]
MSDTDKFMQEEFLPFCKRAIDAFEQNHHTLYSAIKSFLSGKNLIGMRLTKNGNVLGDYTVVLENAKFSRIDNGILSSEIHTPFGTIKPYAILEKSTVEKMIQDEPGFISHPFATKFKYYPEMTIKFLK